ncbi:MAG: hypothetical protein EZS28_038791 [Streblomastix strix]|uniref:Uncharacterized protein n=1 Tax=Streblomastix strix TaxID=222440 RepID=A0A5J4U695_9EUKA|nr:MAG: hypothetical protein EZS28_038791 [Streblomastix strix]
MVILELVVTKTCSGSQGDDEQITQGQCTCGFGHHPLGCLCKDSEDIDCICPSNFGFNCSCSWNVSQIVSEDNIKSKIQSAIDLTCSNYKIQLIDSEYYESINIQKQGNFLIKGHETIGEQAQTIWRFCYFLLPRRTCLGHVRCTRCLLGQVRK